MPRFILASASPRRLELLERVGITPLVMPADVDETVAKGTPPDEYVRELSARKCAPINAGADDIVIAADTVVVFGGDILGKPKDDADARRMLRLLSGSTHTVFTGVTVRRSSRIVTFAQSTRVTFYRLTDALIDGYVATGEPMDKAGAYGLQSLGAALVEKLEGDYFNVVGLPLPELLRVLREDFGVSIF